MNNYEMFTAAGNKACQRLVDALVKRINGDKFITEDKLYSKYKDLLEAIAKRHGEVYDSEPRYHMEREVNKALKERGYAYQI